MEDMSSLRSRSRWQVRLAGGAFVVLAICEVMLLIDVVSESLEEEIAFFSRYHIMLEWLAFIALGFTLVFVGINFRRVLRENRDFRTLSRVATGEFLQILERQMDDWALSASEREIALMLIKGLSIQDIADIRNTKPGTIKSQCNAVYRKAGVNGRNELAAYFIEDLLSGLDLTAVDGAEYKAN